MVESGGSRRLLVSIAFASMILGTMAWYIFSKRDAWSERRPHQSHRHHSAGDDRPFASSSSTPVAPPTLRHVPPDPKTSDIRILVLDSETRKAVEGAAAVASDSESLLAPMVDALSSADDGSIYLDAKWCRNRLVVSAPGYVPQEIAIRPHDVGTTVEVLLRHGESLELHLRDMFGNPVSGVRILASRVVPDSKVEQAAMKIGTAEQVIPALAGRRRIACADSKENGAATITGLSSGRYFISVPSATYIPINLNDGGQETPLEVPGPSSIIVLGEVFGIQVELSDGEFRSVHARMSGSRCVISPALEFLAERHFPAVRTDRMMRLFFVPRREQPADEVMCPVSYETTSGDRGDLQVRAVPADLVESSAVRVQSTPASGESSSRKLVVLNRDGRPLIGDYSFFLRELGGSRLPMLHDGTWLLAGERVALGMDPSPAFNWCVADIETIPVGKIGEGPLTVRFSVPVCELRLRFPHRIGVLRVGVLPEGEPLGGHIRMNARDFWTLLRPNHPTTIRLEAAGYAPWETRITASDSDALGHIVMDVDLD